MPRPATGSIVERVGKDGRTYRSLRFRAYGKRYTEPLGVVSRTKAEKALAHTLADIERAIWTPPVAALPPVEAAPVPTFEEWEKEWWTLHTGRITQATQADYRGRLDRYLIPAFGHMPLDTITYDSVERYIAARLAEDEPLSARTINMSLTLLAAILERAVEREIISRNPAKGKARRAPERAPVRSHLETAEQITALLAAAGELDREAPEARQHIERRAMLATLTFAGLRISELLALRWRDVDLAGGWLSVGESKTDAGVRKVKVRGALRDELLAVRGRHPDAPQDAYVFPTARGQRMSPENLRARVLGRPAVKVEGGEDKTGSGALARANKALEAAGRPPLPKLTPHSLRRTFCSLLYALGEDPGTVMDEMGHTDPGLALRVYRQAMRRGEDEKARLRSLVGADAPEIAPVEVREGAAG